MQRRVKFRRPGYAAVLRALGWLALVVGRWSSAQDYCPCCNWSLHRGDVELNFDFMQSMSGGLSDGELAGMPWAVQAGPGREWVEMQDCWGWHVLPSGLIYRSYLAGPREPRMGTVYFHEQGAGELWDSTLGGRVGLLRYGNSSASDPQGLQIDFEGAAFPRLDPENDVDLVSVDFRAGMPITWRRGRWRYKAGYYHLSSHLGDEFQLKNPDFERLNYVYDALLFGASYFPVPAVRFYGEASWAFHYKGGASPWEFQFGADVSPARPSGVRGDPFLAANVYLRESVDYGGSFTFQTGWQWRGQGPGHLLRLGLQYFDGKSVQFEFYNQTEQQIGIGLWYDF